LGRVILVWEDVFGDILSQEMELTGDYRENE
jgi:hypothetical protein